LLSVALYRIAAKFGTSVNALRCANGMDADDMLKAGQRLTVR
jgi:LysM repeat protein